MKFKILAICLLSGITSMARHSLPMDAGQYLECVMSSNIALAGERLNIDISRAEAMAAKVFNDPGLSLEYANNDDHRIQMGQSFAAELSYAFEPGRRGARIRLAESEQELADALFADYLRNLRFEALCAFYEAQKARDLYELSAEMARLATEVARGDSLRLEIGEIGETAAIQTSIDARMARADAASARTDYFAACVALNSFTGLRGTDTICEPSGTALLSRRKINAASLADEAIEKRADLQAALKDVTVARRALTVEQKERNMDFEVAVGYNYNTEVRNEIAPAPRFSGMSIGLSIPLKFSNSNKGAVTAARLRVEQAELAYTKACNEIRGEVAVACSSYETAFDILEDYPQSLIATSQDVLGQYSELYSRGDVSLLEYKEMRQSQTDLRTAYIEARTNAAIAAAALDHARGK